MKNTFLIRKIVSSLITKATLSALIVCFFSLTGFSENHDIINKVQSEHFYHPEGGLCQANNGLLYGCVSMFGPGGIFEFNPNDKKCIVKYRFSHEDGLMPLGSMVLAPNGKLYGVTYRSVIDSYNDEGPGLIYEFDPTSSLFQVKAVFDPKTTGENPVVPLMVTSNGKIYGMTTYGGEFDQGVLFEFNTESGLLKACVCLNCENTGCHPILNGLIQLDNGNFYGLTTTGGRKHGGTLFEFDISTRTFVKRIDFGKGKSGYYPSGKLTKTANGRVYGITVRGGSYDKGVIFEYNVDKHIIKTVFSFDSLTSGCYPFTSLVELSNGSLAGTTSEGGKNGDGVFFVFNPESKKMTRILHFNKSTGDSPMGDLIKLEGDVIYGLCDGGINNKGVIYMVTPSSQIVKVFDFSQTLNE